jgi:hypothetical protein
VVTARVAGLAARALAGTVRVVGLAARALAVTALVAGRAARALAVTARVAALVERAVAVRVVPEAASGLAPVEVRAVAASAAVDSAVVTLEAAEASVAPM